MAARVIGDKTEGEDDEDRGIQTSGINVQHR
jgi:hypothetical protein